MALESCSFCGLLLPSAWPLADGGLSQLQGALLSGWPTGPRLSLGRGQSVLVLLSSGQASLPQKSPVRTRRQLCHLRGIVSLGLSLLETTEVTGNSCPGAHARTDTMPIGLVTRTCSQMQRHMRNQGDHRVVERPGAGRRGIHAADRPPLKGLLLSSGATEAASAQPDVRTEATHIPQTK